MRPIWFGSYNPDLYQVDHRYSIYQGFLHNVPLNIISNRNNLELVPRRFNHDKGRGCSISRNELYATYLPNPKIDRLVAIAMKTDDEELLIRQSLFSHDVRTLQAKQGMIPSPQTAPQAA